VGTVHGLAERMHKQERRLRRQIAALAVGVPPARRFVAWLLDDRTRLYRVPLGMGLVSGGFLGFLPILGFWMLPLGLLLLALDLPFLRPPVSHASIRFRRWFRGWRRRRAGEPR
jgi:hypothetical protein